MVFKASAYPSSGKTVKLVTDASVGLCAYSIASQIRVSVYDAIYLALSVQEGCKLLTVDQKLINAAPGFPFITFDDL